MTEIILLPAMRAHTQLSFLKCNAHVNCIKRRVEGPRSTARHGALEPFAYLHTWREMPVSEGKRHVPDVVVDQTLVDRKFDDPDIVRAYQEFSIRFCVL